MPSIPKPQVPLTDGVVELRPFVVSDVAAVTKACQDPEISRWTAAIPWPYEEEHARSWIAQHDTFWEEGTIAPFAFVSPDSGEFYGAVSLPQIDRELRSSAIGYWAASSARGRGLTTRAVLLASTWGFNVLGLWTIELMTMTGNGASERVAERAGFEFQELVADYKAPRGLDEEKVYEVKRWVLRNAS
jgi:RimJ/RimL family protein N-acetyltransferase